MNISLISNNKSKAQNYKQKIKSDKESNNYNHNVHKVHQNKHNPSILYYKHLHILNSHQKLLVYSHSMSTHLKFKNLSILMKYSNIKFKKYNHKKNCCKINSNNIKKYSLSGNNKFNKTNKISTFNGLKSKNKDNLFLLDNSNSQLQNKIFPKKFLKLG